jgi:glycosyltransferase involved in cell wall biosynthesis
MQKTIKTEPNPFFTKMPSLCITLTSPLVLKAFLLGHISRLSCAWDVAVCVNVKECEVTFNLEGSTELYPFEIRREVALFHDLLALGKLWHFYNSKKFQALVTVTPKGGLLGMMAARFARIPLRVHWFTGQVWATRKGMVRAMLKGFDRLTAACATHVLADSPSQRDFLVREGVVSKDKISVLGQGSISGVDTARFRPDSMAQAQIRGELHIPNDALCLLYIGRMKKDKGVSDLLDAFRVLRTEFKNLHLLLVGPDEEGLLTNMKMNGLHIIGYTSKAEDYMAAADIICLPSYREGFGSVLIEGAACGLPAVASHIYGITDAVVENVTGLLHPPGDVQALVDSLHLLLSDEVLRIRLGKQAYERALASFKASQIENLFVQFLAANRA